MCEGYGGRTASQAGLILPLFLDLKWELATLAAETRWPGFSLAKSTSRHYFPGTDLGDEPGEVSSPAAALGPWRRGAELAGLRPRP